MQRLHAEGIGALEPMVERFFTDGTPAGVRDAVRTMMLGCPADVAGMLSDDDDESRRA